MFLQDSGQKLTYAQIIQKKKEAAEALERERAAAAAAGQPLETKGENEINLLFFSTMLTMLSL